MPFTCIALDGGAAVGKSSTARGLAQRLGYLYVNTGMHYRSLTWMLLQKGIPAQEGPTLQTALQAFSLDTQVAAGYMALLSIDGTILPLEVLTGEAVNQAVAQYAALPLVRQRLLHYQQGLVKVAQHLDFPGLVMEGRDIGSVILPEARFRFFLTAQASVRQKRRMQEGLQDDICARDAQDSLRAQAPLVCPPGAIEIDTSHEPLEKIIQQLYQHVCQAY